MLLLTDRQVENNSSANVKLSKMQIFKIVQSGGFLGKFVGPLLKIGFSWAKNILTSSTKNILISQVDFLVNLLDHYWKFVFH